MNMEEGDILTSVKFEKWQQNPSAHVYPFYPNVFLFYPRVFPFYPHVYPVNQAQFLLPFPS